MRRTSASCSHLGLLWARDVEAYSIRVRFGASSCCT